jgi:hypothetical protein
VAETGPPTHRYSSASDRRLDDRNVALAVNNRIAQVAENLLGRPNRRAEVDTPLLIDELGRTLGILVAC